MIFHMQVKWYFKMAVFCSLVQLTLSGDHIPWGSILTSMPLWAIVVAHFSYNWTFYTLLTLLPTYMSDVLGFSIKEVSLYTCSEFIHTHRLLLLTQCFPILERCAVGSALHWLWAAGRAGWPAGWLPEGELLLPDCGCQEGLQSRRWGAASS